MIFDVNAMIGHWPFRQVANTTASELIGLMDEAGIKKAAVSSLHAVFYKDAQQGNDELIQNTEKYRDRLIPYAVINPTYPAFEKDFLRCYEEYKMRALTLFPDYHAYRLSNQSAIRLVNLAAERGIPVHIPCSIVNMRQRHHMDINENFSIDSLETLIRACPQADFLITNGPSEQIARKLVRLTQQREGRIYYDLSRVEVFALRAAHSPFHHLLQTVGEDRIVIGTVLPLQAVHPQLVRLEYMQVDASVKNKIAYQNAEQLFESS